MFNFLKKKNIYLDYASATPLLPGVLSAMKPYFSRNFANPSGIHADAVIVKDKIKESRKIIANILSVKSEEIIFTSGATESNNLAIEGFFEKLVSQGHSLEKLHAITSEAEHSSVLLCFKELERKGLSVDYLKLLPSGQVDISDLDALINKNTVFVSVMMVNNETGAIMPIRQISQILAQVAAKIGIKKPTFHTDAVQAPLYLEVRPNDLGVDMLSLDSGKLYGPKGVGLLYKDNNTEIAPVFFGGAQERGIRPGTLAVPLIVGFSKALELWSKFKKGETKRITSLRNWFAKEVISQRPDIKIVGSMDNRIANNLNIFIKDIESEFAIIKLDNLGFSLSSQSACLLETSSGSYVVKAMGENVENGSSIRISMGLHTKKRDLERLLRVLQSFK